MCFLDPLRDTTSLLTSIEPFLKVWINNLTYFPQELQTYALLRQISPDICDAIEKTRTWVRDIETTHSLKEELQMQFLTLLRKLKYYPKEAKSIQVQYLIAQNFRRNLKDHIKWNRPKITRLDCPTPIREHNFPDFFYLKHLRLTLWEEQILAYILRGYSAREIAKITETSVTIINQKVRNLWELYSIDRQPFLKLEEKAA
jgi:hypothetical protein